MKTRLTVFGRSIGLVGLLAAAMAPMTSHADISAGLGLAFHPTTTEDGDPDRTDRGTRVSGGDGSYRLDLAWRIGLKDFLFPVGITYLSRSQSAEVTRFNNSVTTETSNGLSALGIRAGVQWQQVGLDLVFYPGPGMTREETNEAPIEFRDGTGVELSLAYEAKLAGGFSILPRISYRSFSWKEREENGTVEVLNARSESISEWVPYIGVTYSFTPL